MALTIETTDRGLVGNRRFVSGTFNFDESYNVGGELIDAELLGLDKISHIDVDGNDRIISYDVSTSRIKIYDDFVGSEIAAGTDASGIGGSFFALGY